MPAVEATLVCRCKHLTLRPSPLQNTTIEANTANTTGGGVYMQLSTNNIATSSFINNIAKFAAGLFRNGCLGLVSQPPVQINQNKKAGWQRLGVQYLCQAAARLPAWLRCAQALSASALLLDGRPCVWTA